jgi:hypothetical protein
MRRALCRAGALAGCFGALAFGCALLVGDPDGHRVFDQGDGEVTDGPLVESGEDVNVEDAGGTSDAPGDGRAADTAPPFDAAGTVWSDMTDAGNWSAFDLTFVNPNPSASKGFWSGAFDGRYAYYSSYPDLSHSVVMRFDTQSAFFGAAAAWSAFETTTANPNAKGFYGAVFDGHYVYFAPGATSFATRYDTQKAFTDPTSWTTFDVSAVGATGFSGATFDGRYVYFAGKTVGRYDTQASFTAPSSWTTLDLQQTMNSGITYMSGAVFDGHYVYFVPFCTVPTAGSACASSILARFDTTQPFTASPSAWALFDTKAMANPAQTFSGGVFDGRYLYLAPQSVPSSPTAATPNGMVLRYDTQASLTALTSWASFNLQTQVDPQAYGFAGASFDGRFVYLVPVWGTGLFIRYDTKGPFIAPGSWSKFSTTTISPAAAKSYAGSVFDGKYLYFPAQGYTGSSAWYTVRFDTKTPGWIPSTVVGGSFF